MNIGDTVWYFDPNCRVYAKSNRSGPIFREHFRPLTVTGETSVSWVAGIGWQQRKFPKRGTTPSTRRGIYVSQAEIDDACWVHEYRYGVGRAVDRCDDALILRQIAALVGYTPEES